MDQFLAWLHEVQAWVCQTASEVLASASAPAAAVAQPAAAAALDQAAASVIPLTPTDPIIAESTIESVSTLPLYLQPIFSYDSISNLTLPHLEIIFEFDFDSYLARGAQWYLDTWNQIRTTVNEFDYQQFKDRIDPSKMDDQTWVIFLCTCLAFLLYLVHVFHYFLCLSGRPRIHSQHLPGTATQLPPSDVTIDTFTPGPLNAVWKCVTDPETPFRNFLKRPYRPTSWLSLPNISGHLQTMYTARASPAWLSTPFVTYKRELLSVDALSPFLLPGEVALDWGVIGLAARGSKEVKEWYRNFTDTTTTVLICHGLAGGGSEHYVKNLIYHLSTNYGYRCVVFNARGCGGSKVINGQFYCGAYTEDLRQVVSSIHTRLPDAPLLAVGFSLGANILTKFIGEEGLAGRSPFVGFGSIANPFDFILGSRELERTWFMKKVYSASLAQNLITLFRRHFDTLERLEREQREQAAEMGELYQPSKRDYDLQSVFESPTLREFDKRMTRVIFGYATVDDYYRDCSSSRYVKFIKTPGLFLNALDDPISPKCAIPYDECSINPYLTLITTEAGGHSMDWYTGEWYVKSWSMELISHYFETILQKNACLKDVRTMVGVSIVTPPPYTSSSPSPSPSSDDFADDLSPETISWNTAGGASPADSAAESQQEGDPTATIEQYVHDAITLQEKLDNMAAVIGGENHVALERGE